MVVSQISPYFTRTPYSQNFTNLFFYSRHSHFIHDILVASLSLTESVQTLLNAVPVYLLAPSIPSHGISPGRKSNCPCTVCSHVLVFSLPILTLLSCNQVLHSVLSVSAQINCHIIRVPSLVPQFINFDPETILFLGYVLSKNDPSWKPCSSSYVLSHDATVPSL
jgi:hypothetical protein